MNIDEVSVRKRFSLIFSLYTLIFISTRFYTMNGKPLFSRKRRKQNLLVSTTEKILMQPEVDPILLCLASAVLVFHKL